MKILDNTLKVQKERFFELVPFLYWIIIFLIFPLCFNLLSISQILNTIVFLFSSSYLGFLFLKDLPFIKKLNEINFLGISILIGGSLFLIPYSFFNNDYLIYLLFVIGFSHLIYSKYISYKFSIRDFLYLFPLFLLWFIVPVEFYHAKSLIFIERGGDYFYYESIVQTLVKTSTIYKSISHSGYPINYSSFTFFLPAALAKFSQIDGHIAYASMFVSFLKILSFSIVANAIVFIGVEHFNLFKFSNKNLGLASISLLLIAPLHPLYLAKFDFGNFIFIGEGYPLPVGSMGMAFAMCMIGFSFFYLFQKDDKKLGSMFVFIASIATIAIVKPAFFPALVIFSGFVSLSYIFINRNFLPVVLVILGFILGIFLMKIFTGNDFGLSKISLNSNGGYFMQFFEGVYLKYHLPNSIFGGVILFFVSLVLWLGLKLILIPYSFIKVHQVRYLIIIAILTLSITMIPAWFINLQSIDKFGFVLADGSVDTMQFLMAGFFITTIITIVLFLILFNHQAIKAKWLKLIVIIWFSLSLICIFSKCLSVPNQISNNWECDVMKEVNLIKPKLTAMVSTPNCKGQVLIAKGMENYWWSCSEPNMINAGYLFTAGPLYRNKLLKEFLNPQVPKNRKLEIKNIMLYFGVDYLIANESNQLIFKELTQQGLVENKRNLNWLYKL